MKTLKTFVLAIIAIFFSFSFAPAMAEETSESIDYNGVSLLGAGFSLGYYSYGYLGSRSMSVPPLTASYELGLHEYITAGPFLGYARWNYSYSNFNYHWSFIHAGGRASFHLSSILNEIFDNSIDESRVDWYLTLLAGMEMRRYSTSGSNFPEDYSNDYRIFIGPIGGVRYYIGNNFALYFEGGRGALGALSFGITSRF